MTASTSGNKVGMGEPQLFDDVLSAASQVYEREEDTTLYETPLSLSTTPLSRYTSQVNEREEDARTTERGRVGEMEREDGEWESVRLALTHTTRRTHGWRGGDMRQTFNSLNIEADI